MLGINDSRKVARLVFPGDGSIPLSSAITLGREQHWRLQRTVNPPPLAYLVRLQDDPPERATR